VFSNLKALSPFVYFSASYNDDENIPTTTAEWKEGGFNQAFQKLVDNCWLVLFSLT